MEPGSGKPSWRSGRVLAAALVLLLLAVIVLALATAGGVGAAASPLLQMTGRVSDNQVVYDITLTNPDPEAIGNVFLAAKVPEGASFDRATATPAGASFVGIQDGNAVWLAREVPANGRLGPFSFRASITRRPTGPAWAFLHWMAPQEGTTVSQSVTFDRAQAPAPTLEWFGWSHFRITTASGMVILINPFITNNPDSSIGVEDITKADVILAADGHGDEQGDTIALAQKTGAKVIGAGFELGSWFIQQGIPSSQVIRTNPGDRHRFGDVTVRITGSVHGSGLPRPTIENPYGGPAGGFMITLENGFTVYFAGSTAATMDMQLWGSTFKPDLAILPLNNTREPLDVAQMVRLLRTGNPGLTRVIPHHQRLQPPPGATTIAEMEDAIAQMVNVPITVMRLERGSPITLTR